MHVYEFDQVCLSCSSLHLLPAVKCITILTSLYISSLYVCIYFFCYFCISSTYTLYYDKTSLKCKQHFATLYFLPHLNSRKHIAPCREKSRVSHLDRKVILAPSAEVQHKCQEMLYIIIMYKLFSQTYQYMKGVSTEVISQHFV